MSWVSAFDLGACTVKVMDFGGTELFSQVMAKGDTATADGLTITVSSLGAVSLSRDTGFSNGGTDGYSLRVIPSYSVTDSNIRASGFDINVAPLGSYASAFADFAAYSSDFTGVDLDSAGWTPDPADLSNLSPKTEISVFAQGIGA